MREGTLNKELTKGGLSAKDRVTVYMCACHAHGQVHVQRTRQKKPQAEQHQASARMHVRAHNNDRYSIGIDNNLMVKNTALGPTHRLQCTNTCTCKCTCTTA